VGESAVVAWRVGDLGASLLMNTPVCHSERSEVTERSDRVLIQCALTAGLRARTTGLEHVQKNCSRCRVAQASLPAMFGSDNPAGAEACRYIRRMLNDAPIKNLAGRPFVRLVRALLVSPLGR
jgi:hypothetical protein